MPVKVNNVPLKRLQRAIRDGEVRDNTGRLVTNALVRHIKTNWSGRFPPHSKPSFPPAIMTGNLDRNVKAVRVGGQWKLQIQNAEYWYFLEFGTSKMAARPFITPALEFVRQQVNEMLKESIQNAIR